MKESRIGSQTQPLIKLHNIVKRYGRTIAVDGVSLEVFAGETFALFGPSGSGKTSILRLIAGLEVPDWGEIYLHHCLASTPKKLIAPHERGISMVFQDLALWPHLTVAQHIDFALPPGVPKAMRKQRKTEIISSVRLLHPDKYPRQLSGGEKQRLAIARALASEAKILILDEPFSNLDQQLKRDILQELQILAEEQKITMLYVSHQWQEVEKIADRVAFMAGGKVSQIEMGEKKLAAPDSEESLHSGARKPGKSVVRLANFL